MNSGGKRDRQSSWWASTENRSDWLGNARRSKSKKAAGNGAAGKSAGVKQAPKGTL